MNDVVLAQASLVPQEVISVLNHTWLAVPNWKWLVLTVVFFAALMLRPLLQYLIKRGKQATRWFRESEGFAAHLASLEAENPVSWIVVCLVWLATIDNLGLTPHLDKYLTLLAKVLLALQVIRLVYVMVDALGLMFLRMALKNNSTFNDQMASFTVKSLKILTVVLGTLIALQNFGVNVMGVLAGLGLGGLALALAAQDTAANVFGSITIMFDRPFKVGDFVRVNDVLGTVEDIGFRSTRIRTLDNTLVTLPNSVVAKEKIDNLMARKRRRVRQVLGIAYETPRETIARFCQESADLIRSQEKVDTDVTVAFINFNSSSLDILVQFHLVGDFHMSYQEQTARTQTIFLGLMEIAERLGVEFAYPTQTVYAKVQESEAQN